VVPVTVAGLAAVVADARGAGGDRCETATVVPALPFVDTGDTSLLANDYMPACPTGDASDTFAPDAVYRYTPELDELVTISLCGSAFDTKLYVYEEDCPAGVRGPVACSDDDCFGPSGRSFQSHLEALSLSAGVTYYIVVDGYQLASGRYVLSISTLACADCRPDATPEGEPNCGLDEEGLPDDFVNGGCNIPEPLFTPVNLGETVCGTTAADPVTGARDTDWYELVLAEETFVTWLVAAEFRSLIGIVDNGGVPDCSDVSCFIAYTEAAGCQDAVVSARLAPGTWWLYVAPFFQDEGACEFAYTASVVARAPADLDADGEVGMIDFVILLGAWGPCPELPAACLADLDSDGAVGITDVLGLLAAWGT
jgi:hypothetical protein